MRMSGCDGISFVTPLDFRVVLLKPSKLTWKSNPLFRKVGRRRYTRFPSLHFSTKYRYVEYLDSASHFLARILLCVEGLERLSSHLRTIVGFLFGKRWDFLCKTRPRAGFFT